MVGFLVPLSAAFAFVVLSTAVLIRRDRRLARGPQTDQDEPRGG
ncbi:hypothetical protein AB0G54_33525 [Streptomyces yokosukanensis]|nr:hypothetical protein [Streptomyces yokosukanensis]